MKRLCAVLTVVLVAGMLFTAAGVITASAASDHNVGARPTKDKVNHGRGHGNGNGHRLRGAPEAVETERPDDVQDQGESQGQGKKLNFKGTITAIGPNTLTLALKNGELVTFVVSDTTRIHVPTLGGNVKLSQLKVGMGVTIKAAQGSGDTLVALSLNGVPGKPQKQARVGVVTAYTPGVSITIQSTQGISTTYRLTSTTRILPASRARELAAGRRVTIVSPRDFTGQGPFAQSIVVHPLTGEDHDEGGPKATATPTPTATPTFTAVPSKTPTATPTLTPTAASTP